MEPYSDEQVEVLSTSPLISAAWPALLVAFNLLGLSLGRLREGARSRSP